jgi:hypothetical protein
MQVRFSIIAALAIAAGGSALAQTKPGLDTTTFVVMGEGLAAGMANFGLSSAFQNFSFPAQAAAQMNTALVQPLIQPPGIGNIVGYPGQEVRLQTYPQGAVRVFYPSTTTPATSPPIFITNLSVPGLTLSDSVTLRPVAPIAQRDMKQTVVNMILGFPQLFLNVPLWNQFEYAKAMFPSVAMIELGYAEALNAAVALDPTQLPNPATFGATYGSVIAGLRGLQAQVIVTTIPNPLDTAYFSNSVTAASITATTPFVITAGYGITPQDYLTRNALMTISNQFSNRTISPLPAGSVLTAANAASLTAGINALNAQIINVAKANGALVYDLATFLHNVKVAGASIGTSTITANYLGGFYSLDAVYPGPTGNALIANDFLKFLNSAYQKAFPSINLSTVAANDPVITYQQPKGVLHTASSLGLSEPSDSFPELKRQ